MAELVPLLGVPIPSDLPAPVWFGPRPFIPGIQALWRFPNGYGASVVLGHASYGVELAVLRYTGPGYGDYVLDYDNDVTDDVLGHLSPVTLIDVLRAVQALPEPPRPELEAGA